jgi:hypothetical protein
VPQLRRIIGKPPQRAPAALVGNRPSVFNPLRLLRPAGAELDLNGLRLTNEGFQNFLR